MPWRVRIGIRNVTATLPATSDRPDETGSHASLFLDTSRVSRAEPGFPRGQDGSGLLGFNPSGRSGSQWYGHVRRTMPAPAVVTARAR